MARTTFKPVIKRARVDVPGFSADAMARFGNLLNNDIQRRFDGALDVYDNAAPPLAEGYKKFKVDGKYHGAPIRNLLLTGRLRRGMRLLRAQANVAVIGFSDPVAMERMKINNRKSRMYGVSPKNLDVVVREVNQSLSGAVTVKSVAS